MNRASARSLVTAALAGVLAATMSVSAAAQPIEARSLTAIAAHAGVSVVPRVPVIESQAGVGGTVPTAPAAVVPLSAVAEDHDGALVRVSVLETPVETTVFAVGAPALTVPAERSASTTVLVPIVDGGVSLHASAAVDTRVEVLATFESDEAVPGSTHALSVPVTRADTTAGLAGDVLDTEGLEVGVTGQGGVPATGVRAVFVTATVEVTSPSTLSVDGQDVRVSAGVTSVTTIATPSPDGTIPVRLASGEGSLRLDVRGWVPESVQDAAAANGTGSLVPAVGVEPLTTVTSDVDPARLSLGNAADSAIALALVTATPTESTTVLEIGQPYSGRGQGAVVDPALGALPQLTVVDSGNQEATLTVRRGETTATITVVGDLLAADAPAGSTPVVEILAPADGAEVDVSETGTLTFTGTVNAPDASIESVVIAADGEVVGSAQLHYGDEEVTWSFTTSAPASEHYQITAVATDRAGKDASDGVGLTVNLPAPDDVVISEDAVVIDPTDPSGAPAVTAVSDEEILFSTEPAFAPGAVIVSDATANAPQGFLRRVESIDATAAGWVVTTRPAALTDVILQADEEDEVDLLAAGQPQINEDVEPGPEDTTDIEVIDEGVPSVTIATGDDVDVAPIPDPAAAEPGAQLTAFGRSATTPSVAALSFGVDSTVGSSLKVEGAYTWQTGGPSRDLSKTSQATRDAEQAAVRATGGISLTGVAQVGVSLRIALKVSTEWDWGRLSVRVDDFRTVLASQAKAELEAEAYLQVATTNAANRKIAEIGLPTLTFAVGPVPVVITSDIEASLNSTFRAAASISTELSVQRTEEYGFAYSSDGGFRTINEGSSTYTTPVFGRHGDAEVTGEIEASFGPTLRYRISIYDAAGPDFSMGLQAGASAAITHAATGSTADAEVYAALSAGGRVQLRVPIIDHVVLTADLFSYNKRAVLRSWEWDVDTAFPVTEPEPDPNPDPPPAEPEPDPNPDPPPADPAVVFDSTGWPIYTRYGNGIEYIGASPDGSQVLLAMANNLYEPGTEGSGLYLTNVATATTRLITDGRNFAARATTSDADEVLVLVPVDPDAPLANRRNQVLMIDLFSGEREAVALPGDEDGILPYYIEVSPSGRFFVVSGTCGFDQYCMYRFDRDVSTWAILFEFGGGGGYGTPPWTVTDDGRVFASTLNREGEPSSDSVYVYNNVLSEWEVMVESVNDLGDYGIAREGSAQVRFGQDEASGERGFITHELGLGDDGRTEVLASTRQVLPLPPRASFPYQWSSPIVSADGQRVVGGGHGTYFYGDMSAPRGSADYFRPAPDPEDSLQILGAFGDLSGFVYVAPDGVIRMARPWSTS